MNSQEEAQKPQKQEWEDVPYGDYLNAVDNLLESKFGRLSTQEELAYIAECQEAFCSPSECVDFIISDNWISNA